jgi:hypothetical protein
MTAEALRLGCGTVRGGPVQTGPHSRRSLDLIKDAKGIIDFDAKIRDEALKLRVPESSGCTTRTLPVFL